MIEPQNLSKLGLIKPSTSFGEPHCNFPTIRTLVRLIVQLMIAPRTDDTRMIIIL